MGFDGLGISSSATTSIVGPAAAPASGRGVSVQLGKLVGLNLNSVAATTILTTPSSGFTRCVITAVILNNFAGTPPLSITASFGASGTPTDWSVAVGIGVSANSRYVSVPTGNLTTGSAVYGSAVAFVANVTVAQGAAYTCDVTAYGYYE